MTCFSVGYRDSDHRDSESSSSVGSYGHGESGQSTQGYFGDKVVSDHFLSFLERLVPSALTKWNLSRHALVALLINSETMFILDEHHRRKWKS
jgi:hypothetical protein